MLTKRQTEILMDYYSSKEELIPLKVISKKYNVNIRTIQNDMQVIRSAIKTKGMKLYSISSKGCYLHITNPDISHNFIDELEKKYYQNYFFDDPASRVHYILSTLLYSQNYVKSIELADKMYISRSRISADLTIVKEVLAKYHLKLISKPYHGIKIEGSELNKRKCLIKENLTLKTINKTEEGIENGTNYIVMNEIKEILIQVMMDSHYQVSDIALQNLIIHIATAVERIRYSSFVDSSNLKVDTTYQHVYEIAKKIMEKCVQRFHIPYNEQEVILLTLNLHGKREYDSDEYISDEINNKIYDGLMQIKNNYGIDLSNDLNLRISLGLHLIPLLSRLKTDMLQRNTITYNIKQNFAFAFDLAWTFSNTTLSEYKEKLSDDEISYIALHFSKSLDETVDTIDAKNVLLISSQKKSDTILIQQKLLQWFHNIKEIVVISKAYINEIDLIGYNLIITTEQDIVSTYPQMILIDYFPTECDYKKIERAIKGFNSIKDILDKFDESLFYHGKIENKQEAIDILYQKAHKKGIANNALYKSIMLHEEIASSYFGNSLAILHPETLISKVTFIGVAILEKSIPWEDNQVDLVFLVSIEKDNPTAYKLWYYLSFLISNEEALQKIIQVPTYENLISVIYEVYKNLF